MQPKFCSLVFHDMKIPKNGIKRFLKKTLMLICYACVSYGQTIFFDFAQILQVGYHWPKNISSKGIFLAAFGVCRTSMPLQNGRKITPYLASTASATIARRNGIQTKRHHSTVSHLSTLQKLKDHYISNFVNEPGDDSLKQLNFTSKIAQFQPHFLHLMQRQILHSEQS